jgi:hypothetical protein
MLVDKEDRYVIDATGAFAFLYLAEEKELGGVIALALAGKIHYQYRLVVCCEP